MTTTVRTAPGVIEQRYLDRTERSRMLWQRAASVMPLGVAANLRFHEPYPVAVESATGGRLRDVDGNEYLDVLLGVGANLLGHRHPAIDSAVRAQLERAVHTLLPTLAELELAERLAARYPVLERVRFTPTGSEATRSAVRVARAVTGRTIVAKLEGHYHGSDDVFLHSAKTPRVEGARERPLAVADSPGQSPGAKDEVLVLPWDPDAAVRRLDEAADQVACVIVEPIGFSSAGALELEPALAAALRAATTRHGSVLIFDEIVTAHRLGPGGAAAWLAIEPDLVALGKAIGGGFPIAAFGGRAELMEAALGLDAARRGSLVFASGTFAAHPAAVAAGLAVLDEIEREEPAPRLDALAARLRRGLNERFEEAGATASATGAASITQVHFASVPPRDRRGVVAADQALLARFLLGLVTEGVMWPPIHAALICTAHSEADIDAVVTAAGRVLEVMVPLDSQAAAVSAW